MLQLLFLVCSVCIFLWLWVRTKFKSLSLFGCCWLVPISVTFFNFIPQVKVFLFYCCSFRFNGWLFGFFKTSFKIIPGFGMFTFYCSSFSVDNGSLFVSNIFLRQRTVTSFYANSFTFLNNIRFSIHSCMCLIFYSIRFTACTLHSVWRKCGSGLLTSTFSYIFSFSFSRRITIELLFLILNNIFSLSSGYGQTNFKFHTCAKPPTLAATFLTHSN